MSVRGDIYLGASGSEILVSPFGRRFTKTPIESTREERTTGGTLKKDVMYIKHDFSLNYSIITGTALAEFQTIFDLDSELSLIYWEGTTQFTHSVYMEPFRRRRTILLDDGLYSGVNIKLTEA